MQLIPFLCITGVFLLQAISATTSDYRIYVKTGRGLGAGTDAKFWLQIVESEGHNVTFVLDGNEEKLERNSIDVFKFKGKRLSFIDYITIQRQPGRHLFSNWFIRWIKIEFEGRTYYTIVNKWLNDDYKHYLQMNEELHR